jgi:pimeloyl-ACP methyl ester carboxylesterase/putative sterol carrier protein
VGIPREVLGTDAEVRERMFTLPTRYRRGAADGFAADFDLSIDGVPYSVAIGAGRADVKEGRPSSPTARIVTDAGTWLALDDGTVSSIDAFLQGRVMVRGNVERAVRMQSLFRYSGRARTPQDLEHVVLRSDGLELSAFELGRGHPVVLIHGLGATKLSWMPLLGPLAERYRVLALDLPGHGDSAKPRAAYTPAYFASVVRDLLDSLGIRRAALVGNSMGGRIALEVAGRLPGRVSALALLGPAVAGLPFPYFSRLLRILPNDLGAIPLPFRRRVVALAIRQLFSDPERLPRNAYLAGADEFVRVYRSARARVALLAATRGLMRDRPDLFWDRVRQVGAPALILWGNRDRLVPLRLGQVLADTLPDAELAILPDVGHVPQFEVPDTTVGLLRDFLDRRQLDDDASVRRKQAPRGAFGS